MQKRRAKTRFNIVCLFFCFSTLEVLAVQDPFLSLEFPSWTNGQIQLELRGETGVTYVVESSLDLQNWVPVATNSNAGSGALISIGPAAHAGFFRAWRNSLPLMGGLIAQESILLNGNLIKFDSYNSADPAYSTNGLYDPAKRKAGGDIAANGVVNIGNAAIYGKVRTSVPGNFIILDNGRVGDLPSNWAPAFGVEPGWVGYGFSSPAIDVVAPYNSGLPPPNGTGTNTYVLGTGSYYVNGDITIANNKALYVGGVATLYVTGNFICKIGSRIIIGPGAVLKLYVGSPSGTAVSSSFDTISNGGPAYDFQYFGLPTNKQMTWSGVGSFVGTMYAPQADVVFDSGGGVAADFQGACVVKSFTANGDLNFHYDENLRRPVAGQSMQFER